MIFGHHFDFQNEPSLQKEYSLFPFDLSNEFQNKTTQVIESSKSSPMAEFSLKTDWVEMSGQEARYSSF
jgi:hypothetical protein